MVQQEDEKMKVYGRKSFRGILLKLLKLPAKFHHKIFKNLSTKPKSSSSIPIDLVSEILLKLPAKSIVRFRCVSKLWSSITTDPYFIKSFETRSSPKPSLLIFFKKFDKFVVFSFPQHHRQNSNDVLYSSRHVDRYEMECPPGFFSSSTESVHGLICFQDSAIVIIWNPTMRRFLTLPKPDNNRDTVWLGYDPIEGRHKLLSMGGVECWVLTLGSSSSSAQESSWRRIKTNLDCIKTHYYWRCINGVLYFLPFFQTQHSVLLSFDVRSETFQQIRLPLGYITTDSLIAYEGKLAFVHSNRYEQGIKMSILEDAEKEKWVEKSFHHIDRNLKTKFNLSDATEDGELIFIPSMFSDSSCIVYYDPKRGSFRKVELEGIADEEFRLSKGLGKGRFIIVNQAFPNHIDSLISL